MLIDTIHLSPHLWPRASLSLVRGFLICAVSFAWQGGEGRSSCDPPNADALGAVFGHFALGEDVPGESPPSRDVDRIDGSEE